MAPKIVPGFRSGQITVESPTEKRRGGYILWKCRCVCGAVLELDTRHLQRGTVTSCGCIPEASSKTPDLSGQRFGRLVCLTPVPQKGPHGHTLWECQCDCGSLCQASASQLIRGGKKSCGCLQHPPLKDFPGRRFGKLTVLDYAGKRAGMHRWRCRCDCGKETVVGQTLLQSGKTRSCGCIQASTFSANLKLCEGTSVTVLEAGKKRRIATNTSGHTGVYYNKTRKKWVAQITFQGTTRYLGSFDTIEEAIKARQEGERVHDEFLEWYYGRD